MNIVYRVESTVEKDRASVISNCEKEGWSLYKIDDNFISFKKEVPSHFISSYYVIHGDNVRTGPFESEEKAKASCKNLYLLTYYIERVWQDAASVFKSYSRMDRIAFLAIDDFEEEIVEKLFASHAVENPQQFTSLLRDSISLDLTRDLTNITFDGISLTNTLENNLPNPSNGGQSTSGYQINPSLGTLSGMQQLRYTTSQQLNHGLLDPSGFIPNQRPVSFTEEERRTERDRVLRAITDYARELATSRNSR